MVEIPAKGVRGVLISTLNGGFAFRVYKEDHSFVDYDLFHNDLEILIVDDKASLYEDQKNDAFILDHDSKTLGIKK